MSYQITGLTPGKQLFNVAIAAEITYYAVDKNLSDAIKRGRG